MVIVAFLSALLAGMGVGSAGLLVVYLTLFEGLPQLEAQMINMIFFSASAAASLGVNLVKKRLSLAVILSVAVPGCLGAAAGAYFAHSVEPGALGKIFGGLMVAIGALTLFRKDKR